MQRNNKQTKQTLQYTFFIILLVIFLATVGVKLLINTSIFVSQYSRTKDADTQGSIEVLAPAQLYDVPDATNSARLVVSGSATKGTDLTLYVNEEAQDAISERRRTIVRALRSAKLAKTTYMLKRKTPGQIR